MGQKIIFLTAIVWFFVGGHCLCLAADGGSAQMPVGQSPIVTTIVGNNAAQLAATRYPEFYAYEAPGYTQCGEYLKTLNGKIKNNVGYQLIPGLQTTFAIPKAYRKTAKLLFTWTVRIEEAPFNALPIAPSLCQYFVGTSYQRFAGGQFHTQLYINNKAVGSIATLSVPGSTTREITQNVTPPPPPPPPRRRDPTLTGSCLISPGDLGLSAFPDTISVEVRWYNDTCLPAQSPENMRTLIITILPV